MRVEELIRELSALPPHAEVRVAMDEVIWPGDDDASFHIAQTEEAQTLVEVRNEGAFVGLYA